MIREASATLLRSIHLPRTLMRAWAVLRELVRWTASFGASRRPRNATHDIDTKPGAQHRQAPIAPSADDDAMTDRPTEVTAIHTRLLRVTLEVEPSVAYWKNAELDVNRAERARTALEERWFGDKTEARVRKLVDELSSRYDPFPEALAVLRDWPDISPDTRSLVCHWHVQLTDPVYRRFTGELLVSRRQSESPKLSREATGAWLNELAPSRWSEPTVLKYAGNLLTTAAEAGLMSKPSRERQLLLPSVPDDALGYILQVLRGVDFEGTLADNPYLASVGLRGDVLEERLHSLPGFTPRKAGDKVEIDFEAENLSGWARTLPS